MTRHVSISEAGSCLPELVAAALGGEEVILDGDGAAQVRLVPVPTERREEVTEEVQARRRAAFGMFKPIIGDRGFGVGPSMTDEEVEERWKRKFGPAA